MIFFCSFYVVREKHTLNRKNYKGAKNNEKKKI